MFSKTMILCVLGMSFIRTGMLIIVMILSIFPIILIWTQTNVYAFTQYYFTIFLVKKKGRGTQIIQDETRRNDHFLWPSRERFI